MGKKFSDEEFDEFLEQEFLREADVMEDALFSDDDFEDAELSDEEVHASYDRLVEKLKKEGKYREETETSRIVSAPAKKHSAKRHPYRLVRAAGFVAVCVLGVFAASMTSEANRKYFVESIRYLTGDDTRLVINNDSDTEIVNRDEYAAISEIKAELGVEMPDFHYRPEHFEYYSCEVNKYAGIARMEYQYNGAIIVLEVDKNNSTQSSGNIGLDGQKIETLVVEADNESILVSINQVQDIYDKETSYTAQWKLQDVVYQISGKIEKEELEKMVQYMKY